MSIIKSYYVKSHNGDTLVVDIKDFSKGTKPLLWENKGLYHWITATRIDNIITELVDAANLSDLNKKKAVGRIYWSDTDQLDQWLGRFLFNL